MEKAEARQLIKTRIQLLEAEERKQKDRAITQAVLKLSVFKRATGVMLFASLADEFSTRALIEQALKDGKTVALPRTVARSGEILPIRLREPSRLAPGTYHIPEPVDGEVISLKELQFILVPGRAFDDKGNRLGRGRGYYDRFLSKLPAEVVKCGAGYDCQLLDEVPATAGDVPVDLVVTEAGVGYASRDYLPS